MAPRNYAYSFKDASPGGWHLVRIPKPMWMAPFHFCHLTEAGLGGRCCPRSASITLEKH